MPKTVFISFALEDKHLRDKFIEEAKENNCPVEFIDLVLKDMYNPAWQIMTTRKVMNSAGTIILVTKNTKASETQKYEIKVTKDERAHRIGVWGGVDDKEHPLPPELNKVEIIEWDWEQIREWIEHLN